MKVLLTGANGFLGTKISDVLKSEDIILYTLGRSKNMNYSVDLASNQPHIDHKFSLVIHAAGKAHMVPSNKYEEQAFINTNVTGTKNLLLALERSFKPESFVFISSVSVYGLSKGSHIDENSALLANDAYGMSKILGEELVKVWCNKHQVKCTILRLPLLVGERPPGNLGSMIKAIKKGYYFNITNNKAKKSMVLAEDVARCIIDASKVGGIYNLTDGYHPDFYELSACIAKQLNTAAPISLHPFFAFTLAKLGDCFGNRFLFNSIQYQKITSQLTFDDRKARIGFGWKPRPVLDFLKIN
jgi:nucleoside-diphosphate-sugar epimerase